MKKISKSLLILSLFGAITALSLQSCWKDRTILDKLKNGDTKPSTVDITPGYGLPLFTYHVSCEDFLKHINEQNLDKMFEIRFNENEDNLAYFIYQNKLNIILDDIDVNKPTFDTVAKAHLIDWGMKERSLVLHRALFLTRVENYYDAMFTLNQVNAFHEDASGNRTPLTLETQLPVSVGAGTNGNPGKTELFISTDNPIAMLDKNSFIGYDMKSTINKQSNANGHLDFNPDIYLPLWLDLNNLVVNDTIEMNVAQYVTYNDSIEGVKVTDFTLIAKLENYFPAKASVLMTLLDENYNAIGTMYPDYQIVEAATFGNNFKVTAPAAARLEKSVKEGDDLYNKLLKTRYAEIKQIYTSNGKEVKLFKDNYLKVKMNFIVNAQVKGKVEDIINSID